jgi:hypothetical protein
LSADEATQLASEQRTAAQTGLSQAQNRTAFAGLAGDNAGLSADEREDTQAIARRDAVKGLQATQKPVAPTIPGAPLIEGLDNDTLGVGLRTAFRNESTPQGILTGGRRRGGVRWRDENPSVDAPAERIKHFEYTDPASAMSQEEEYGSDTLREGSGDPKSYAQNYSSDDRRSNTSQRKYQMRDMVLKLPRGEAQTNTFAQDIAGSNFIQYPKSQMPEDEGTDFDSQALEARETQNRALGVRGYSTEGRKRIARTANGSSGFFSSLMGAFGLDRLFGRARDRTFDAVPSRERRTKPAKPKNWFQRLFGTGRGSGN